MRQTRVEIGFGDRAIDGVMCGPERAGGPMPGVVVAHPHPLLGGNADHPVVYGICRELAARGIMSLRFSFTVPTRDTEGLLSSAADEIVRASQAVAEWDPVTPARIGVAGYSFGAAAVLRALPRLQHVAAISLIVPPVNALTASTFGTARGARQVIAGTADKLVRPHELQRAVRQIDRAIEFQVVSRADHNFTLTSDDAARMSAEFLLASLNANP